MLRCIPNLFGGRPVEMLDKRHCNLSVIPDDVLRSARSLEELMLDSNHIKELGKNFFRLSKLQRLRLSDNEIQAIPNDISSLHNLAELDFSKNDIGIVPETIKFCKCLCYLDISSNPITAFPECVMQCKSLKFLGMNDISLTRLPDAIGGLLNLQALELRENLLTSVPSTIVYLARLELLDLGNNELEMLPEEVGRLTSLRELYLDGNNLSELPDAITSLRVLQSLDISENRLERLPQDIGDCVQLSDITLSLNCIEQLPHSVGRLKNLQILKLDQNRLTSLTPAIGSCGALTEMTLQENILIELPSSIGNLRSLKIFNTDRNRIRELPSTIGGCERLAIFTVRENALRELPTEIGNCKSLRVLDVSCNMLRVLPASVSNLTNLQALWLSNNQSKPLLRLQSATDDKGNPSLSCYLLPQQHEDTTGTGTGAGGISNPGFVGGPKVHFPDVEDASTPTGGQPTAHTDDVPLGIFERHDTPHPKPSGIKLKPKSIDGHVVYPEGVKIEKEHVLDLVANRRASQISAQMEDLLNREAAMAKVNGHPLPNSLSADAVVAPRVQAECDNIDDDEFANVNGDSDQHVGFADPSGSDQPGEDRAHRLKRKDTPHHLKNKRLLHQSDEQQPNESEAPPVSATSLSTYTDAMTGANVSLLYQPERVTLHIDRSGGRPLGLSIAGGTESTPYKDNDEGIFVSRLTEGGAADQAGLKIGDKLLMVNDVNMSNGARHVEAVGALRDGGDILRISIMREVLKPATSSPAPATDGDNSTDVVSTVIAAGANPGFQIAGGAAGPTPSSPRERLYVSAIESGGPAELRLQVGDRLTAINGMNVDNSSFDDAVRLLKQTASTAQPLHLVVERMRAVPSTSSVAAPVAPVRQTSATASSSAPGHIEDFSNEEVTITKVSGSPLGLSIVGGSDNACHPFGASSSSSESGVFISKIVGGGTAARSGRLRIGDRILDVNGVDLQNATHREAVQALVGAKTELRLRVRHEAQPAGLAEVTIVRRVGEKLGMNILGGVGTPGNPHDPSDDGIFIESVIDGSAVARDGRLKPGTRLLEVNQMSLLGSSLADAIDLLRGSHGSVRLMICDGLAADALALTATLPPPDLSSTAAQQNPTPPPLPLPVSKSPPPIPPKPKLQSPLSNPSAVPCQ